LDWSILIDQRQLLADGVLLTIELSIISALLSFVIGSVIGTGRHFADGAVSWLLAAYTEFFRNIPPIVQLFFWYFGVGLNSFAGAVIGLSVFQSAYIAEVVRSGLQSIPKTQGEAAQSSGLSFRQTFFWVMFPQAIMRVVPALSIEFINVIKNSSVAMTIGIMELTFQTQEIASRTFRGFEAATAVTLLYIALAFVVVLLMKWAERVLKIETRGG
jgi:His/Glu/Gln/Arg/opine family amino acid ABC transporter permease subunit